MSLQLAKTVLMIQPTNFGFNEEAFQTNSFQNLPENESAREIQSLALKEFNGFVKNLKALGVNVLVFEDVPNSKTPDSIFPNNWFSTHQDGKLITYPMAVSNRREERREDIILALIQKKHYAHTRFEQFEDQEAYLEGTGSLIFDHQNQVVYAAISPRTHLSVLEELTQVLNYEFVAFESFGKSGELIYHTNVMMCVGDSFIAIGLNTIKEMDKAKVLNALEKSGKEIIELSNEQVYQNFAGNMLQVQNNKGERVLILSEKAYHSFTPDQLQLFKKHTDHFVLAHIPTIEKIGGGSARCMVGEIF